MYIPGDVVCPDRCGRCPDLVSSAERLGQDEGGEERSTPKTPRLAPRTSSHQSDALIISIENAVGLSALQILSIITYLYQKGYCCNRGFQQKRVQNRLHATAEMDWSRASEWCQVHLLYRTADAYAAPRLSQNPLRISEVAVSLSTYSASDLETLESCCLQELSW